MAWCHLAQTYDAGPSGSKYLEVAKCSSHQAHSGSQGIQGTEGKEDFLEHRISDTMEHFSADDQNIKTCLDNYNSIPMKEAS
jgi:hypothetical protein